MAIKALLKSFGVTIKWYIRKKITNKLQRTE